MVRKLSKHPNHFPLFGYSLKQWILILLIFAGMGGCDLFLNTSDEETDGDKGEQWYKGSLHVHSYWSNGNDYPEQIIKWYKNNGYHFLSLSEHNTLAEGDRWMEVPKGSNKENIFQEYLEEYGEEWVEYADLDTSFSVKLKTSQEYGKEYDNDKTFLLIQSEEIHDNLGGLPIHINATNVQQKISPQSGSSVVQILQNNINAVLQQRDKLDTPILPQVNHPNIDWAISVDDMKQLNGVRFFELYSGHPNARNYGDVNHPSTEEMWDEVNTHYLQNEKPLLYGLAVDDAQNYHTFIPEAPNPGRAWVNVRSSELSRDSILAAMQRGDFYSSTGVNLNDIKFNKDTLSISIDPEPGVSYITKFIGVESGENNNTAQVLAEMSGTEPKYIVSGNEIYIRAKVLSDKRKENTIYKGETESAWIQPQKIE